MKKGQVRDTLIYTKITEIEESLELVKKNMPHQIEEFVDLGIVKDGIYKRLEYAIENVFDICHVINADLSLGIHSSEDDVVQNLMSKGIIDSDVSNILIAMRRFRNIVVHRYGKIDDKIAFSLLENELEDFVLFNERIRAFLKSLVYL